MAERKLEIGGFYRHFKNKFYQVKCIAYHSETRQKMVVYQALYGDFSVYVRPYDMFVSEVDHVKYPDVSQLYRFEQVSQEELQQESANEPHSEVKNVEIPHFQPSQCGQVQVEKVEEPEEPEEDADGSVDTRLLAFLDSETYKEKLDTLATLKLELDDKLIDAMAASLDVEVPEGSIDKRYASLRSCILAHAKYECSRLR